MFSTVIYLVRQNVVDTINAVVDTYVYIARSKWQILDSSKFKAFADDNFEFDEDGRKLSKKVFNNFGEVEIAR